MEIVLIVQQSDEPRVERRCLKTFIWGFHSNEIELTRYGKMKRCILQSILILDKITLSWGTVDAGSGIWHNLELMKYLSDLKHVLN